MHRARIVEIILSGGWHCDICRKLKEDKAPFETVYAAIDANGRMAVGQTKLCIACYTKWMKFARFSLHRYGTFADWVMKNRKTA